MHVCIICIHIHMDFCSLDSEYDAIQCTLVDCPGHASLIRTIIGGLYYNIFILLNS